MPPSLNFATRLSGTLRFCLGGLAGLAILLAVSVEGQVHVVHDGNWWRSQSDAVKVGYVIGCMDHVTAANPDWAMDLRFDAAPRINDVCGRLDLFYAMPSNRDVLLQMALPAALMALAQPASR